MQAQQERWPLPSRHKLIQRHQIRPQENYSCLLGAKLTVRWPAQSNYVKKICELQRKHCPYWEKSRPVVCCDTIQGGGGPDKVWAQKNLSCFCHHRVSSRNLPFVWMLDCTNIIHLD